MNPKVGRYDYDPTSFSCVVIFSGFTLVTDSIWHTQDSDDGDPHGQSKYPHIHQVNIFKLKMQKKELL